MSAWSTPATDPDEIRSIGLITPDFARLQARPVGLRKGRSGDPTPATLADGDSLEVYFESEDHHHPNAIRSAWARDTLNHEHIGRSPAGTPRVRWRA